MVQDRHILGTSQVKRGFALLLAFILALGCLPTVAWADEAAGETEDFQQSQPKTAWELQQQIEDSQTAYADAQAAAEEAREQVEAHEQRLAEIEREIPAQQKRTAQATRELYKIQQHSAGIVDMLLSAGSFGEFLRQMDYVMWVNDANYAEVNRLAALKRDLDETENQLRQSQDEANQRVEESKAVLEDALEAQAENQRRLEEEARLAAEAAANAAALADSPRTNNEVTPAADAPAKTSEDSTPAPSEPNQKPTETTPKFSEAPAEEAVAPAPELGDNTVTDESTFIAEWAPRIDAYLNGSPLAGQGTAFARAAYAYNVDPRFSPAISCTESGKGSACFLPHNAWGWGSCRWDSWEEAINDHVRGLASGYGYTITVEGAKKYCPPNWKHWYNTTLSQMNLI